MMVGILLKPFHAEPLAMGYGRMEAMLVRAYRCKAIPAGVEFFQRMPSDFWTR